MKKFFTFLFSASLGALYGLFFAQKSGKKLREDIRKSKNPGKKILNELKEVATESGKEAADWAENSEEVQKLLKEARKYFDTLVEKSKDMSAGAAEQVEEQFLELSERAAVAAKRVKASAEKKVKATATKVKTVAKKKATKFKNDLKKEAKTVAKKLKK